MLPAKDLSPPPPRLLACLSLLPVQAIDLLQPLTLGVIVLSEPRRQCCCCLLQFKHRGRGEERSGAGSVINHPV